MKKIGILVLLLLTLVSCNKTINYDQTVTYEEAPLTEYKPNCGFYEQVFLKGKVDGIGEIPSWALKYNHLLHLRIDISCFSKAENKEKDLELTEAFLNAFDKELQKLESASTMAIIRFAYDPYFNGQKDMEPTIAMMEKHIRQFSPIINQHQDAICAVECGLVGPWGEMHSSQLANKKTYNVLIKTYLDCVSNLPILVRRPQFIFDYLNINTKEELPIITDSRNQRLGVYNDGYLGSGNDLGTYFDREKETKWLSIQNERLPYGGEVTIPGSTLHDIDVCLPEMNLIHLSYLNQAWNDQVIQKWKNQIYQGNDAYQQSSAYDYIRAHMGYLLVMEELKYSLDKNHFSFQLSLTNKGFGNILKKQNVELVIVSGEEEQVIPVSMNDDLVIEGSGDITLSGKCDFYIRMYTKKIENLPLYSIPFGNNCFDEKQYANLILDDVMIES